jgi:hypothetical protein
VLALPVFTLSIMAEKGLPLMEGPDCRQNACNLAAMA